MDVSTKTQYEISISLLLGYVLIAKSLAKHDLNSAKKYLQIAKDLKKAIISYEQYDSYLNIEVA